MSAMNASTPASTPAAGELRLSARGLDAGYHGHPVVRDFDVEVRAGEVVALLGPNGAGKSTTLSTLAGTLKPIAGEVVIDGASTRAPLFRRARGGLAYVPEDRSVFMHLSTRDNLRLARGDVQLAHALFPALEPLLDRRAGLLSGGEQQMLTLARGLARRPTLLLADELSLGLAPLIVARLLEAVRRAADDDGVGVLLVEQHVNQALRIADRVLVMRRGQIVLQGTVAEVESQLEQAYLAHEADHTPDGG